MGLPLSPLGVVGDVAPSLWDPFSVATSGGVASRSLAAGLSALSGSRGTGIWNRLSKEKMCKKDFSGSHCTLLVRGIAGRVSL